MQIETVEGCADYRIDNGVIPIGFAVLQRSAREKSCKHCRTTILLLFDPSKKSEDVIAAHTANNPDDKILAKGGYKYVPGIKPENITFDSGNLVSPTETWIISYAKPMDYRYAEQIRADVIDLIKECIKRFQKNEHRRLK